MKLATFNLYQFVELKRYWFKRHKKNRYKPNQWHKKKQWILDQLECMNADIVAFQEVFSVKALAELTKNAGYDYFATIDSPQLSSDDNRVYRQSVCAVASRLPIIETSTVESNPKVLEQLGIDKPFKFARKPVRVVIQSSHLGAVIVYAVHLKSKRPTIEDIIYPKKMSWDDQVAEMFKRKSIGHVSALFQRGAEAALIYQSLINDIKNNKTYPIVLMGDLNDDLSAITNQALVMQDYINNRGDASSNQWPKTVRQMLYDYRLYDSFDMALSTQQSIRPFTHLFQGRAAYLDYILVSNQANPHNPKSVCHVSDYKTLNSHLTESTKIPIEYSDHAQLVITLTEGRANKEKTTKNQVKGHLSRQHFIKMAGGVYQSRIPYGRLSSEDKWNHFWAFFFDTHHGWVRSVYGSVSVETLFKKQRHSIEHIIPASFLHHYLIQKRAPKQVRYGASMNPFNLLPSDKKINSSRSNFPFDMSPKGEVIRPYVMKIEDNIYTSQAGLSEDNLWVVPSRTKGDIARAILYMVLTYEIDELYNTHIETLIHWCKMDEPSSWEIAYNKWVYLHLGIRNPLIDEKEQVARILESDDLMQSALFRDKKNNR